MHLPHGCLPMSGLRAQASRLVLCTVALLFVGHLWAAPPAGSPAFAFRDTADGVSCHAFDVATIMAWPGQQVPWVDAAGQAGGAKPFDTQRLGGADTPRALRFNVLALVKAWATGQADNEGFLIAPVGAPTAAAKSSLAYTETNRKVVLTGGADFYSREAEDVGLRPSLRVVHADGAVELLSPQADAGLDCSTHSGLGNRDTLHIGPDSKGVLRFDLSRLRKGSAANAKAAELVLVRTNAGIWSEGALGVFRLTTPWTQVFEKPSRGLAAAFSGDRDISKHPAVLFADAFDGGKMRKGWNTNDMVRARVVPPEAAPTAAGPLLTLASLRATIPRGENLGLDLRFDFPRTPGKPDTSEAYLRYYLRLGPEWASSPDSGKFPGLAGTYGRAAWGGRGWHGMEGWSARGSFLKTAPIGHPARDYLVLASYVYHSKSSSGYGEILPWGGSYGTAFVKPGRWYCIEQHIKLNTPGREDGVLRAWVDGQPVFERRDLRLRDTLNLGIENAWMDLYMGGSQTALRDMSIQIGQVVVATQYIGPIGPVVP
jgi:hypothetical protein